MCLAGGWKGFSSALNFIVVITAGIIHQGELGGFYKL